MAKRQWMLLASAGVLALAGSIFMEITALAGTYPTNVCVSKKMKAAATKCKSVLKAWSKWEKDPSKDPGDVKLNAALTRAGEKFLLIWGKADQITSRKGIDCAETTAAGVDVETDIDAAVADVVTSLNADIDWNSTSDRICRARLLRAAAIKCSAILKVESKFIKKLKKDPDGSVRTAARQSASNKFDTAWSRAACNTSATVANIEGKIDSLAASVVESTTWSPNVSSSWVMITPDPEVNYQGMTLKPMCVKGTDYVFFVRRGTVNKLFVYYQGGGACWDFWSCGGLPTGAVCKQTTGPGDNPSTQSYGFADLNNPANPFKDWNAVFVPYCSCDVHWGDKTTYYSTLRINHRGFHNSQVAEKWAREHFVNPTDIFVTGSSAGAYGAIMGGIYLNRVYPASRFSIVGDAGNGVITQDFLAGIPGRQWGIKNWGAEQHMPRWIPELDVPIEALALDELWSGAANFYPRSMFGQYTTAWDGSGGGQVAFYNVMQNPISTVDDMLAWTRWWEPTCEWHDKMVTLVNTTAGAVTGGNYRYYIGAGSRHTMWGSDKVYTDTTGGVPTVVDWISDMMTDPPGQDWINAECTSCDLVNTCQGGSNAGLNCADDSDCPGGSCQFDVSPSPLAPPYEPGGVVNCP